MSWIGTALISTAILGLVAIIDSHIISKRVSSVSAYLLPIGIFFIVTGVFFMLALRPFPLSPLLVIGAIGSSLARAVSTIIMFSSLRTQHVSKVIPVVYAYPVFVALLALPILGESLEFPKWLAVPIVVTGTILASIRKDPGGSTGFPVRSFLLLTTASLLFAASDLTNKMLLHYMTFWYLFTVTCLTVGSTFLALSLRSNTLKQISKMKSRNRVLTLVFINEVMTGGGMLLTVNAISNGPVSLVSTILGSRPVFVALYAVGFSFVLPQFLTRDTGRSMLALRIAAAFVIVGGITLIYLR